MKKKNLFRKLKVIFDLLMCSCFAGNVIGQTLEQPTKADKTLFTTSSSFRFNTAMIAGGSGYIFAAVEFDGTNSKIYVRDPGLSTTTTASTVISGTVSGNEPNITIGNSTGAVGSICTACNSSTDYILAISYVNSSNNVEIEFYDVYDDGSTTISITHLTNTIISPGTYTAILARIDVIADYTGASVVCHKFVVTFCDLNSAPNTNIYVAYGDLNSGSITSGPVLLNPVGVNGNGPAVAGIQKTVSGSTHDIAIVTYNGATNTKLYVQSYDFTSSTASSIVTLDTTTGYNSVFYPRIDAIDDYRHNGNNANANFEVVREVYDGSHHKVRSYDNTHTTYVPSSVINVNGIVGVSGPYDDFQPTVSVGYDGTNYIYSVLHYMDYDLTTSGTEIMFMEPLKYTASNALWNNEYYWVNSSTSPPAPTDGQECHTLCLNSCTSSAPNDYTQPQLYAWAWYNSGANDYELSYKLTTIGGASPYYTFKQSPANATGNATGAGLQVYPNPATDQLTVQNTNTKNAATQYQVLDISGRELLQGSLEMNATTIDISKLTAGTYIIKMSGGTNNSSQLFIKN